jgi:curved DNA-binding protein
MAGSSDLYAVLGVERTASRDEIQKAYKKLARQYHPDLNPGDAQAEERFKEIASAYRVLSDPERRANYDEFGDVSLEAGFDAEEARKMRDRFGQRFGFGAPHDWEAAEDGYHFGDIDDLLGRMFGGGGAQGARGPRPEGSFRLRGSDLEAGLELDFLEAARGVEKQLTLHRPAPDGSTHAETVKVRIPPGVDAEGRLRIPGKGGLGMGGGAPGDLWVQVHVRPHPVFRKEGRHLTLDLPIHAREAMLGARVEVPTLEGRSTLTIPPGTQGGARLRLKGKGIPAGGGRPAGDLLVRVQIRVPRDLDDETRKALGRLEAFEEPDIRGGLFA